jgi:hypothetical protein
MKVALVCIAKDEDNYIQEWIDYHKKIGFDRIFIYENNWRCKAEDDMLTKIPYDGEIMQVPAYNDFIKKYYGEFDWVLFLDVDEFLVLKKQKTIQEMIKEQYKMGHGFAVNWVLFGGNNHEGVTNNNYSVIKRFTKRDDGPYCLFKTLLKLSTKRVRMLNPHRPNLVIVDTDGRLVIGDNHNNSPIDITQVNHYFCKTQEEYLKKVCRGSSDGTPKRNMDVWHAHNKNEVEDRYAYNFMYI